MEEYKKKRSKMMVYKCMVCKKKCKDEDELRKHALLLNHYYKVDSKED